MTPIRFSPSSLKEGRWYEYLIRFGLGGAATVFTGLVGSRYGASVGGLFLALPAIFCASATLIEKHEIRRKEKAGPRRWTTRADGGRARRRRRLPRRDWHGGLCGCLLDGGAKQHRNRLHRRVACLADGVGGGLVPAAPDAMVAAG
jgi:hypothetical protein